MATQCEVCGAEIPPERLEFLPDTQTCTQCSQTSPYSEADIIGQRISRHIGSDDVEIDPEEYNVDSDGE